MPDSVSLDSHGLIIHGLINHCERGWSILTNEAGNFEIHITWFINGETCWKNDIDKILRRERIESDISVEIWYSSQTWDLYPRILSFGIRHISFYFYISWGRRYDTRCSFSTELRSYSHPVILNSRELCSMSYALSYFILSFGHSLLCFVPLLATRFVTTLVLSFSLIEARAMI